MGAEGQLNGNQEKLPIELMAKRELSEAEAKKRVLASFNEIQPGIKLEEELLNRLALIERYSNINTYSRLIAVGVKNILNKIRQDFHYEIKDEELQKAQVAALIHDVGKAGPVDATPEQQMAVIKLFAAESLGKEMKTRQVENVIRDVLFKDEKEKADSVVANLRGCQIDVSMSLQEFWDSHTKWGYQFNLQYGKGLPKESIEIAALHHVYRDPKNPVFNPLGVEIEQIPKEALALGPTKDYVERLIQRAIIVIDQYEAQITRSKITGHEEAIKRIEKNVSEAFAGDAFMNLVFEAMRRMGQEKIFNGKTKQS